VTDIHEFPLPTIDIGPDLLRTSVRRNGGRTPSPPYDADAVMHEMERHYGLGLWMSWEPTEKGSSNDSFFIWTEAGSFVVRRSSRLKTIGAAHFECALIDHLLSAGYPAPPVVRTRDGGIRVEIDGRIHMVMRRLYGGPYERADPAHQDGVAHGLGRYHRIVAYLPTDLDARQSSGLTGLAERGHDSFARAVGVVRPLLDSERQVQITNDAAYLESEAESVTRQLDGHLSDLTYLITHASYDGSALLLTDNELTAVVAYDRAVHDLLDFDLAYALKSFCRGEVTSRRGARIDPGRCQTFIRAYRTEAPLSDADIWALPLIMRAQRLVVVVNRCRNLLTRHAVAPRQTKDAVDIAELVTGEATRLRRLTENCNDLNDLC